LPPPACRLWNKSIKHRILAAQGSIQNIPEIPDNIKEVYKTVWEMKMRSLIDMAADRGAFIDQSQVRKCHLCIRIQSQFQDYLRLRVTHLLN
jgi:ribonucleoside-diphosphate reductase alpha chain